MMRNRKARLNMLLLLAQNNFLKGVIKLYAILLIFLLAHCAIYAQGVGNGKK